MATEVGKAYVTLVPSAKGFAQKMQAELAGDIGKLGKEVGEELQDKVSETGTKAGQSFGQKLAARVKGSISGIDMSGLAGKVSGAGSKIAGAFTSLNWAGMAAKAGELLSQGLTNALDMDAATHKIAAQLGLSEFDAQKTGAAAGKLFAHGYGTGADQIAESLKLVTANVDDMRDASQGDLEDVAGKVLDVANIWDQDMGGVTRAVGQAMKTGMAKDADEALDIIVKGFQGGVDKSDDFLDTLNEYGTQFRKLGLSGETATGLLSQGIQGGARDADIVADALKEFSIRSLDSFETLDSKGNASLNDLGLAFKKVLPKGTDIKKFQTVMAGGGPKAAKGLQTVLTGLKKIKDPAQRSRAAVALFGTQAEDLGDALYSLDPSTAAKGMGKFKGAAAEANKVLNDTPEAKIATFKRTMQQGLTDAMVKFVIPAIDKLMPLLDDLTAKFDNLWPDDMGPKIDAIVQGVTDFIDKIGLTGEGMDEWTALFSDTWTAIQDIFQSAIDILLSIWSTFGDDIIRYISKSLDNFKQIFSGIIKIITGIFDIVAGLIKGDWSRVWDGLKSVFAGVWQALGGILKQGLNAMGLVLKIGGTILLGIFKRVWELIKLAVMAGVNGIVALAKSLGSKLWGALKGLGSFLAGVFRGAWNKAKDAVVAGVSAVVNYVAGLPGRLLSLGSSFLSAGKSIINLFIEGLKGAAGVAGDIAGSIWGVLKGLINDAIDRLNRLLEFSIPLPGKDIPINPPDIGHLAQGGRVTSATLAIIGEGSEPETVLPDSKLLSLIGAAQGSGGQTAELTITNWREGTGYFRLVAAGEVSAETRFRRNLGAMNG